VKKLLLLITCFAIGAGYANEDEQQKIYIQEKDNSYFYLTTGAFSYTAIPAGANIGFGYRLCGDNFALGTSLNMSAGLVLAPALDLTIEGLYFTDARTYFGLQVGAAVGKTTVTQLKYKIEGEETIMSYKNGYILPILKVIPYGREWEEKGQRHFWHVALFPVGLSFSYGWEL